MNYKIYHWDTFDNTTIKIGSTMTLEAAEKFVQNRYGNRIQSHGADRVDIVDIHGNVVQSYSVG